MALCLCATAVVSIAPAHADTPPPDTTIKIIPQDGFNLTVEEQLKDDYVIVRLNSPAHNWFAGTFTNLPTDTAVTIGLSDCVYCSARERASQSPSTFVDTLASIDEQEHQLTEPFAPRFHQAQLNAPFNTRVPAVDDSLKSRVLTCWQGELFGPLVPQDWIDQVLAVVKNSVVQGLPWQYIFLTKYPSRFVEIVWPENAWVGVTVDAQQRGRKRW